MLNFQDSLTAESKPATAETALNATNEAGRYNAVPNSLSAEHGDSAQTLPDKDSIDFETFLSAASGASIRDDADIKRHSDTAAITLPASNSGKSPKNITEADTINADVTETDADAVNVTIADIQTEQAPLSLNFINFDQTISGSIPIEGAGTAFAFDGQELSLARNESATAGTDIGDNAETIAATVAAIPMQHTAVDSGTAPDAPPSEQTERDNPNTSVARSAEVKPPSAAPLHALPLQAAPTAANTAAVIERAAADHAFKSKDQIETQLKSQLAERQNMNAADLDTLDFKGLEAAAPMDAAARLEPAQSFALAPQAPTVGPAAPAAISIAAPIQTPLDKPAVTTLAQTLVRTLETQKGVSVRLDPPEMGRVYIDYQFDRDNTVTALLRADTPEILAQLRDNSATLQEFLKQSGFDSVTLNFEQSDLDSGAHQKDPQNDNTYKDRVITLGGKQETLTAAQAAQTISGRPHGLAAASIDIKL